MTQAGALRQFGTTQQKLLRALLQSPQGATVESLCETLSVTHNAIRQHLTALIGAGLVERGSARPTGGRPQSRYLLLPAGRDLFPRHYGLIAASVLEHLYVDIARSACRPCSRAWARNSARQRRRASMRVPMTTTSRMRWPNSSTR
jgi:predicted ArsR family transcriptional regulator